MSKKGWRKMPNLSSKRLKTLLINCVEYINGIAGSDAYETLTDSVGFSATELDTLMGINFNESFEEVFGNEEDDDIEISKSRLVQIMQKYVENDANSAEPDYIREALSDICGITKEEAEILGFSYLLQEDESDEEEDVVNMTYSQLESLFNKINDKGLKPVSGYIIFTEDSFNKPYSETSRTYEVPSNCKAYQSGMGGYSIFGSCLDGTDPCVRLEGYMRGESAWKIEKCYMKKDDYDAVIALLEKDGE